MASHETPLGTWATFRISDEQRARLRELAEANHRTVAGEIRHMLDLYLEAQNGQAKKAREWSEALKRDQIEPDDER